MTAQDRWKSGSSLDGRHPRGDGWRRFAPLSLLIAATLLAAMPARAETAAVATAAAPVGSAVATSAKAAGATTSFKVAQSQSIDNWQQRAFSSIEEQKRLDALPRVSGRRSSAARRAVVAKAGPRRELLRRRAKSPAERGADVANVTPPERSAGPDGAGFAIIYEARRLQLCLQAGGHYEGTPSGSFDKPTFDALDRFRRAEKLLSRPQNPFDPVLQQRLLASCPDLPAAAAPQQQAAAAPAAPQAPDLSLPAGVETLTPAAGGDNGGAPGLTGGRMTTTAASASRLHVSDLMSPRPVDPNTCAPQPGGLLSMDAGSEPSVTGALAGSGAEMPRQAARRADLRTTPIEDARSCLPRDLYDLLSGVYGEKPELTVCQSDCLPAPESFNDGQRSLFAKQYAINWCGSDCLRIGDPMPLDDVMRIERDSNTPVCINPQSMLMKSSDQSRDREGVTPAIRALFDRLPGGYGNADNLAVIIGNRNYAAGIGSAPAAHLEADAMRALLVGLLGYKADNVIVVKDATRDDLVRLLGGKDGGDSELARRLKTNPNAQLAIYYAGHAGSGGLGFENYLLPVDASAGKEADAGYALEQLYDNLRKLDARSTLLFLEAGFGGRRDGAVLPPNVSERKVMVAPVTPVRGLAVFTATEGDQQPLIDAETGLGLFTRFLITGLAGKADAKPFGNADSILDSVELHVHIAQNVRLAARKTLGLMQSPTLSRADNLFLSQLSRK
jgi:hypothetical protein